MSLDFKFEFSYPSSQVSLTVRRRVRKERTMRVEFFCLFLFRFSLLCSPISRVAAILKIIDNFSYQHKEMTFTPFSAEQ